MKLMIIVAMVGVALSTVTVTKTRGAERLSHETKTLSLPVVVAEYESCINEAKAVYNLELRESGVASPHSVGTESITIDVDSWGRIESKKNESMKECYEDLR